MKTESYIEKDVTITWSELENGYALPGADAYIETYPVQMTYFRELPSITEPGCGALEWGIYNSWNVALNTWGEAGTTYDAVAMVVVNELGAYQIAFNYDGTNICYFPATGVAFDPDDFGYTLDTLTKDDFRDGNTVTVYGYARINKVNDPKNSAEAVAYEIVKSNRGKHVK